MFFKNNKFILIITSITIIIFGILITSINNQSKEKAPQTIYTESKSTEDQRYKEITYRSMLGNCPTRPSGNMALQVLKVFEEERSLRAVKSKIVDEKWSEKYFVNDYKITYDPYTQVLNIKFDCPKPLMKVQIYKQNGIDSYDAILVDNGELLDPTYEVLLRSENKLDHELPYFALPISEMENKTQETITEIIKGLRVELRKKLAEVILNDQRELTMILSMNGHPFSVFMGMEEWQEKIAKLDKIVNFLELKEKFPSVINLSNSKKVVVKFRE